MGAIWVPEETVEDVSQFAAQFCAHKSLKSLIFLAF
jgi:hypothetical protein